MCNATDGQQGTADPNLQWMVGGQSKWKTEWKADVWHNVAYDIDFSGGSVSFWHSTGAEPLKLTAGPVKISTSSVGFPSLRRLEIWAILMTLRTTRMVRIGT